MRRGKDDWGFGDMVEELGAFGRWIGEQVEQGVGPGLGRRRRRQLFESGEVKFLILELLREKPRHGYEIIKALEEKMGGHYTPSPGTIYPTLQLLEDQGHVRVIEAEGRRVFELTAAGLQFLDENRHTVEEILARVRSTVRDRACGPSADFGMALGRVAQRARHAWRHAAHQGEERHRAKVLEILRRTADDLDALTR